jgi:DoxX-like protein
MNATPRGQRRAGLVCGALAALFLLLDAAAKVLAARPAVEGTVALGYPEGLVAVVGVVELACVVAYAVPRTAVLGAILLTGYLGGAVATHVRIGSPLASHVLFPVYVALLVWGALFLRDARLRALVPLSARSPNRRSHGR